MYLSPQELTDIFGLEEISKLATPNRYPVVNNELLLATIQELERDSYSAIEIAAADETLSAINDAIEYATQEINSYLIITQKLPLDDVIINSNPITGRCADMVRYRLAKSHPSEETTKRYNDAIIWLKNISLGKAGLYNPNQVTSTPRIRVMQTNSLFDWEQYGS